MLVNLRACPSQTFHWVTVSFAPHSISWSRGPRTPEGLERSRRANWKHGHFSREAKAERSRLRAAILAIRYLRMLSH
jgi:hypothetical protein